MATTTLTGENFVNTINDGGIVLVDFWASWCGPCRQFAPIYEAASDKDDNKDIVFGKVDTEDQQELAGALNITSIPTTMVFRDGIMVFSQAGAMPAPMLDDVIQQTRELPMDEIKAKIAEEEAKQGDASAQTDAPPAE